MGTHAPYRAINDALIASVSSSTFVDVQFELYSRRVGPGKVGAPAVVYGNSAILEAASPWFRSLLRSGFAEATDSSTPLPSTTDSYDYESDSDLEDDSGVYSDAPSEETDLIATSRPQLNDSVSECIHESTEASVNEPSLSVINTSPSLRSIAVPDIAVKTWRCLLAYIYTGEITFAPLKSHPPESESSALQETLSQRPRCSPKSMYRLADKLGFEDLKRQTMDNIQGQLNQGNIIDELFCTLSSRFPGLMKLELTYLRSQHLSQDILPDLRAKTALIAAGRIPHGDVALNELLSVWIQIAGSLSGVPENPPQAAKDSCKSKPRKKLSAAARVPQIWASLLESD